MLGKRTGLKWADFDTGEARSIRNWLTFSSSMVENENHVSRTIYSIFLSTFSKSSILVWYVFSLTYLVRVRVKKTLMNVFILMFCLLDGFILYLWKKML